jgi:AraC-like DNA-binding protein
MEQARYEYPVNPALAPFVKSIWSFESNLPTYHAPWERILPDGCVELVFHFRDPFLSRFANGEEVLQPISFVVGQMRRFLEIRPAGQTGFVAVRLYAHGAYRFFPRSLNDVAAGVVDLPEVWRKRGKEWTDRVASARGMQRRVQVIEQALMGALCRYGQKDPTVDRCLNLIALGDGQWSVVRLAEEIGLSSRHLNRRFQGAVGMSPKEFSRVRRFLSALPRLKNRKETLTEIAVACGYFDQAHFNHDFREFAGMAPGELSTFPNVAF